MMMPKQLFVLDLDRTMANTRLYGEAEEALKAVLGERRYRLMRQTRRQIEATGGSFDFVAYLDENNLATAEFLHIFRDRTGRQGGEAFRNDGATHLLKRLTDQRVPFIFMTYGGEVWQRAKLAATGFDTYPVIITSTKEKGRLIREWQQDDKSFVVTEPAGAFGPFEVSQVVLVDDKPEAFVGLPPEAIGYLLDSATVRQVSPGVNTIASLDDVSIHSD